jgi:hypothetical protein
MQLDARACDGEQVRRGSPGSFRLTKRMEIMPHPESLTAAVRRALDHARCDAAVADLLFLEAWEASPSHEVAAVLRVAQIRRANPELADAVRIELAERRRRR